MTKFALFVALLIHCLSVQVGATEAVVAELPYPDRCDDEGRRCEPGSNGRWVEVRTAAESLASEQAQSARLTQHDEKIRQLWQLLEQQEGELKLLASKADQADRRIAALEAALKALRASWPAPALVSALPTHKKRTH